MPIFLYIRILRKFDKQVNKSWLNCLHAIAWGCFSHICLQWFSQGQDIRKWIIQFHALTFNN